MADESNLMMKCLDLIKQVLDSQGKVYINIRMGDSFQFTFNNQDSVGSHKKKSHSQQARDTLRQQEFEEKKLKEEIVDSEKEVKDYKKVEGDTLDKKDKNEGTEN